MIPLKWQKVKVWKLATQACLTLCDAMDCSPPGSFVHGNSQATILELVTTFFSMGSSQHRDQTWVSCIASRFFTVRATREAQKVKKNWSASYWEWKRKVKRLACWKLSIQKTKIMTCSPTTSWQIEGEKVEGETDFISWISKITEDGECNNEIKRCLFLWRKAMTNLDSILKSRGISLQTKIYIVKAMFFPVVVYVCKSRTMKKAEHWRIDVFELWCWGRLLKVPWITKRSNQSIWKEISP